MNFFRQKCDMERNNNNNATDTMMCKETMGSNDDTTTHTGADNDNDENDKYMIWVGEKKLYQWIWYDEYNEASKNKSMWKLFNKIFFDFLEDAEGRKNGGSDDELNR